MRPRLQMCRLSVAIVLTFVVCGSLAALPLAEVAPDTLSVPPADTLAMATPPDTPHDSLYWAKKQPDYWKKELRKLTLDVNDTAIVYPRFIDFCLRLYRWGDRTFNSYDTAYVVSTGKNWKVMFKTNGWFDSYLSKIYASKYGEDIRLLINSEMSTSLGFRVQYMALGVEYMPDIDNLISLDGLMHRRTRFSFTCSRIAAEAYFFKNEGTTHIHRFGSYNDGHWINVSFVGLTRKTFGVDLFYFFNHMKYAHSAAYCFSKIQRRSAGSFILGFQFSNQHLNMDFSQLPDDMQQMLPQSMLDVSTHYYDYAVNVGYGYNWVPRKRWLINLMATPSVGWKHGVDDSVDGPHNLFCTNIRLRMAVDYTSRNFFYGLHGNFNGYWYYSDTYRLFNTISDITLNIGFRF